MHTDRERIEELHEADMRASKNGDMRTLRGLMSDDAVVLPPGGQAIRGRNDLDRSFASRSGAPSTEVLEYRFDWQEVEICGDYAFEWGYVIGRERNRDTGLVTAERFHVLRILQRQADGQWKVHRSIWNDAR